MMQYLSTYNDEDIGLLGGCSLYFNSSVAKGVFFGSQNSQFKLVQITREPVH